MNSQSTGNAFFNAPYLMFKFVIFIKKACKVLVAYFEFVNAFPVLWEFMDKVVFLSQHGDSSFDVTGLNAIAGLMVLP
jgi:hypothetical protein